MRPLTRDPFARATFTLECLPEDIPVKGNAMASGDDEVDRKAEQWVYDQLDAGNEWAWCCVKVTARLDGFESEPEYLGCCSYESEASFREPGGYFDDMKRSALKNLREKIEDAKARADAILSE